MEQSELLRTWISEAGMIRAEAADALGVKGRRLACWLLPVGSKGRRAADDAVLQRVHRLRAELQEIRRWISEGRLIEGVDARRPFSYELPGDRVLFPALFRCREPILESGNGQQAPTGEMSLRYSFSRACADGGAAEKIEALDPAVDAGCLSVVHLRSLAEVEGFLAGQLHAEPASSEICVFNHGFFALRQHLEPSPLDGLITYASRCSHSGGYVQSAVSPEDQVFDVELLCSRSEPDN